MIRKAIIILLTLAAVGTAALGIVSYWGPEPWFLELGDDGWLSADAFRGHIAARYLLLKAGPAQFYLLPELDGDWLEKGVPFDEAELCLDSPRDLYNDEWVDERLRQHVLRARRRLPLYSFIIRPRDDSYQRMSSLPDGTLYRSYVVEVVFPLWAPFIVLSIYPIIAFIRGPFRRYRRRKKGLCIQCGYNLTGNTSGICPECGSEI